ncbi:MAG: FecR domain-containing protein [Myxococcales bacterium]
MSLQHEVDLSKLREAKPPPAVARRVVEEAMARSAPRTQSRGWLVAVAVAFAVGVALAVVFLRPGPMTSMPLPAVEPMAIRTPINPLPPSPAPDLPLKLTSGQVAQADKVAEPFRAGRHQVKVAPRGKVLASQIEPKAVQLKVESGAAKFEVEPLEADEVFSVSAGALTFEAVGTRFEVEVEGDCTRLEVQEGIVRVRRDGRELELVTEGKRGTFCEGSPAAPESLSEEDQLLSDALDQVRGGIDADLAQAVALLKRYVEKYPTGLYQQEALYYLARLSQRLGRTDEAKVFAGEFLSRWSTGRRADELRAIAR